MKRWDVLVIGAGIAGVFAALSAAQQGASVCLVTKGQILYGNTRLAAGNIAGPGYSENDPHQAFVEDLLKAGEQVGDPALIHEVAEKGLDALKTLESWGFFFKRNDEGLPTLIKGGGHQNPRTFSSPYRGSSLCQFLRSKVASEANIDLLEGHLLYRLLVENGRVWGAVFLNQYTGEPRLIEAGGIVLATGGAGMLYGTHTDNAREATGDGMAAALMAGARLVDMEFIQWMPFAVTRPADIAGINCGEPSSAGPQGMLVNGQGEPFLRSFHTMTRAQVAKAIFQEINAGKGTENQGVLFDPRGNKGDPAGEKMYQDKRATGTFDVIKQAYGMEAYQWSVPYEVAPTAHFTLGGIVVDPQGKTDLEGLYAAGEVTGGFHGADRLAAVAFTECFVFGRSAGLQALAFAKEHPPLVNKEKSCLYLAELERLFGQKGQEKPEGLIQELGEIMWQGAGGIREQGQMDQALLALKELKIRAGNLKTPTVRAWNQPVFTAIELDFLLLLGEGLLKAALLREESRGSHSRQDYPVSSPHWEGRHIYLSTGAGDSLLASAKEDQP